MQAGKRSDRITFQRQSVSDDGYGNVMSNWSNLLTCWADMLERLGGEKIQSGALEAPRLATIRVLRAPETLAVTEADRIVARGQTWNIRSIAAVGRTNEELEMLCETQVAT
jgi:SPP1 family predicted phage head-tail adaptor